ncbi:MAG: hypothetical protein CML65_18350 [Rhodobacteraceae bacterium]|nr:hypothetical protein [Paracoccaceae bacterium]
MDSRIFIRHDDACALIVNMKCGYSTVNRALVKGLETPVARVSAKPRQDLAAVDERILFVRHPVDRFVSYYKDKVIRRKRERARATKADWDFEARWMEKADLDRLKAAGADEAASRDFFNFYVSAIGPAFWENRHTVPQWAILQGLRMTVSDVSMKDYRENLAVLKDRFGVDAGVRNVSKSVGVSDALPFRDLAERFCEVFYARDYDMFGQAF